MNGLAVTTQDLQKLEVFIKSISFNDETALPLTHSSIVVFTGANNCGKSQVLRDIEKYLQYWENPKSIIVSSLESEFIGEITKENILEYFEPKKGETVSYNNTQLPNGLYPYQIVEHWQKKQLISFSSMFVHLLNTGE